MGDNCQPWPVFLRSRSRSNHEDRASGVAGPSPLSPTPTPTPQQCWELGEDRASPHIPTGKCPPEVCAQQLSARGRETCEISKSVACTFPFSPNGWSLRSLSAGTWVSIARGLAQTSCGPVVGHCGCPPFPGKETEAQGDVLVVHALCVLRPPVGRHRAPGTATRHRPLMSGKVQADAPMVVEMPCRSPSLRTHVRASTMHPPLGMTSAAPAASSLRRGALAGIAGSPVWRTRC